MSSKNKIIDEVKLPTLSRTLLKIIEVEKLNPISFLDDIKKIVEKDPLLSAHLLKVANSSFYGFSQKVRTISHAIGLLGVRKIKTMAFSFSIFDFFKNIDYKSGYGGTFNLILKKSLLTSSLSTILAKKISYLNSEELYVSGLLSEIGQTILFLYSTEKYCDIYSLNDRSLISKEREIFQTDHVELGLEYCNRYSFPDFFKTAVKNHAQLSGDDEHSRISFISAQIAELLLTEDEEEKVKLFKEIENNSKKLLHLSLPEIEETVKGLPAIMDAFIADFPEVQKDLHKVVEAGASIILSLMKREMEMVMLTQKLTTSQQRLAKEKIFLSHMLNLSYFFSSLMPPPKIISSLFEYFENFITEFSLEFVYRTQVGEDDYYQLISCKEDLEKEPKQLNIKQFSSLVKSKISNEAVHLEESDKAKLGKKPGIESLIFPISYHHNFFGFLILNVDSNDYIALDLEMSYVQILSNIIANSFQNYLSFEGLKNETNKKELVTKELLRYEREMNQSREVLIDLQKSEILGELLPVIFHKLKNKLTPILGYSQILLTKVDDKRISDRLKKIEKNANDLANQLNILREYFKTERTTKEIGNLNSVIRHLEPYFKEIEKKGALEINLDLDDRIGDDLLNLGQLETLIGNIVDNGVLAIKKKGRNEEFKGRILIKTGLEERGYKLTIRDNGTGISEESLTRMWAPFYTDFPGRAGIGLSICEKIITNHNANYNVHTSEGKFTEFEVFFTRQLEEDNKKPLQETIVRPKKDIHGKILIVDDEAYLLDLMKEILMSEGNFEIFTTISGKEALDLIERFKDFDLVITDIRMPDVDGMQIYKFLKSKYPDTRVLVVTADPYSEDVAQFLNENHVKYLRKPFELMKFKQLVLDQLSRNQ